MPESAGAGFKVNVTGSPNNNPFLSLLFRFELFAVNQLLPFAFVTFCLVVISRRFASQ